MHSGCVPDASLLLLSIPDMQNPYCTACILQKASIHCPFHRRDLSAIQNQGSIVSPHADNLSCLGCRHKKGALSGTVVTAGSCTAGVGRPDVCCSAKRDALQQCGDPAQAAAGPLVLP